MISFIVPGEPIAQPRHRIGAPRFGGGHARAYIPKEHPIHTFKEAVALSAKIALQGKPPLDEPLKLTIYFVLPRPKRLKKKGHRLPAPVKPDLDNLAKGVKDAMTKAGVWTDDNLVVECLTTKEYAAAGEVAHTCVRVETL